MTSPAAARRESPIGSAPQRATVRPWVFGVIALCCFAAAAVISSTYFVVSDTSCVLFRWGAWTDVCQPTMVRWSVVAALLIAVGVASVAGALSTASKRRGRSS